MRVWDPKTANTLFSFHGNSTERHLLSIAGHDFHSEGLTCLATKGTAVLTGSTDTTARVSNISTGKVMVVLTGHKDSVEGVGFCNR